MPIVLPAAGGGSAGSGSAVSAGAGTLLSPTASTSQQTLTQNVLMILADRPYPDKHTNSIATGSVGDTITLTVATDATTRYEVGDVVEWRVDGSGERALVTAVAATSLTCVRGQDFTTPAAHLANAQFVKGTRFEYSVANKAVADAILTDLFPHLFSLYQTTYTPASPYNPWYVAPAGCQQIVAAYQKTTSTPTDLNYLKFKPLQYVDSTFSSTLLAFQIPSPASSTQTIFVQYTTRPAVTELSSGAAKIVEYGACARLLEWEAAEMTASDMIKQSGTLAPGQPSRDANWYLKEQARLRAAESALVASLILRPRRYFGVKHL